MKRVISGVRWDPEMEEFQLRCESCAAKGGARYWPLTLEFWQPGWGMTRCRACVMSAKAAQLRNRLAADPVFRARKYAENRARRQYKRHMDDQRRRERIQADPQLLEARRAYQREATRRYRARLKEQAA